MNDTFSDLASTRWWVSVVIAGLLINLLSAYLKPLVDRLSERISVARRLKSETQKQEFESLVGRMLGDGQLENDYRFRLINSRLQSLEFLMAGLFFIFMGIYLQKEPPLAWMTWFGHFFYLSGLVSWLTGIRNGYRNTAMEDTLTEVRKRRPQAPTPAPGQN